MAIPKNIRLNLVDYAPPEVLTAKAADKRAFVSRLAEMALFLKRREIVRGIGPDGKKFKPRKHPRADGADGAALSPHGMESRTAALLAAHEAVDFVTLFWRAKSRKSWAKILGYHAMGMVRGAPIRDEFGLSPKTQRQIKADMALWWKTRKKTRATTPKKPPPPAPPAVVPLPKPKPAPRPRKAAKPPAPEPIQPTLTSRGRVVYVPVGQKADPLSKKIQVIETRGRKPRTPPPPAGPAPAPVPRKPAPRPAPAFVPQPNIVLTPTMGPLRFVPAQAAKSQRMQTVWVDVAKLDEAFQKDSGFAIKPGGAGAIGGRIEGFHEFLKKAKAEDIAIEQSQVVIAADGSISFVNGRHRFSVLRDLGVTKVPISVPRGQVGRARRFFGAT